jgi:response regulator RpfG family c-di-GMP phosphodiesterase
MVYIAKENHFRIKAIAVDDDDITLAIIANLLKNYPIDLKTFTNPFEALDFAKNNKIDIVLIDYIMPEMNGIEFIKQIKIIFPDILIIMITSVINENVVKMDALEAGATEFLNKPLIPAEFRARMKNLAKLLEDQILIKDKAALLSEEVIKATKTIQDREYESLTVLARVSEFRDLETAYHIERVAHYSKLLARANGLDLETQNILFYSAPLHDIGKIGISDSILLKPEKLTPMEYEIIKQHTEIGYKILKGAESIFLKTGAEIAISHHEKFDGTGYPDKIKAYDIPLFGRIVAISDVFDALTTSRPYKEAWTIEESINLLISEKGKQFDPGLVDLFIINIKEVKEIFEKFKDS